MVLNIPEKVKKRWDTWNLRAAVITSLLLQIILILFASSRKRRGKIWIILLIWAAYLLADWVAAVAIGFISSKQHGDCKPAPNAELMAFWSPFLLLHLGGPDTITSFSLEDNELWIRHLLTFILQAFGTVYIFLQTLPKNRFWLPTILVFIAGVIRYAERIHAMYLASLDHFGELLRRQPDAGPEYEMVLQTYSSISMANLPVQPTMVRGPGEEFEVINYLEEQTVSDDQNPISILQNAFRMFETFKGLITGLLLSSQDRHVSRDFFLTRSPKDVFRVIEMELSLIYEVLHTKVIVVRTKTGFLFRFINIVCIVVAFFSFSSVEKVTFNQFDVRVSQALFVGAIALDIISFMFMIFSDWTIHALEGSLLGRNWLTKLVDVAVINRRRWSKLIGQFSFLEHCLYGCPRWLSKLVDFLCLSSLLETLHIILFTSSQEFEASVWNFIFKELKHKALGAKTVDRGKKLCLQKGDGILNENYHPNLKWSVSEAEYVESLLMWHIATDLCHQRLGKDDQQKEDVRFCKLLSDYMFYLVVVEPAMMSAVSGNWEIVYRDTIAETKRFLKKYSISNTEDACTKLLEVEADIKPGAVKGDSSKSVLFDACIIAQELEESTQSDEKWDLMAKVWVELLSYAAINCRPNVHAQRPSKGGELLTFVWLLMNHLGLGTQFQEQTAGRIKFIVKK